MVELMKTKYDWSNIPSEVKWIATDADGVINGFYTEPSVICEYKMWIAEEHLYLTIGGGVFNCLNWQDSLEERPQ